MERLANLNVITMATTLTASSTLAFFLLLLTTTSSVLARPHVRPLLTLADLNGDGAIPKKEDVVDWGAALQLAGGTDSRERGGGETILAVDEPDGVMNDIRFDAVDLPSQFETYDLNRDRRVSLNELSIVTGTKEIDAIQPFRAADANNDNKISFEEFKKAPWIFGATYEVEVVDGFIHELVGEDV